MEKRDLAALWREEEDLAHIRGWDFSHIQGRYSGDAGLPWDYRQEVLERLRPEMKLLDVDTGGGEFLLSLGHPYDNTSATEAYPPNVCLCRRTLSPLGIDFRPEGEGGRLPFDAGTFDMVINRHGSLHVPEIARVLKPGGIFVTEQVGAENDRELVERLLGEIPLPFPEQYLEKAQRRCADEGLTIRKGLECFRPIRFYDVGALVWFARVVSWEFSGFSVATCEDQLWEAQRSLERDGCVEGRMHRFLLVTEKKN